MKPKIAFITSDWDRNDPPLPGGAGWVRLYEPASMFKEAGYEVAFGHGIAQYKDHRVFPVSPKGIPFVFEADIVVIQRWMNEDGEKVLREARAAGQVIINDIDDYFMGLHESNMAHRNTSKQVNKQVNREAYKRVLAASDVVTCSTPFLARRYSERLGVKCEVLRNMVNVGRFTKWDVRDTTEDIHIGWVGAMAWRSQDLETTGHSIADWIIKNDGRFVHNGRMATMPDKAFEVLGIPKDRRSGEFMRPAPLYPQLLGGFDVGIVPLNRIPFNMAKSAIKGMEYAAANIPYIATRTPEYEWFGQGDLVDTPDDWYRAFDRMKDPAYRRDKADAAYEHVLQHDINTRWHDWEDLYLSLLKVGSPV